MRSHARISLLALVVLALLALSAAAAQAAGFGVEKFVALDCSAGHEGCAQTTFGPFSEPNEPSKEEAEEQAFTQAGGHVPFGITDFKVNTEGELAKLPKDIKLVPGMPAEIFAQTGERTVWTYLVYPLTVQMKHAFLEQ